MIKVHKEETLLRDAVESGLYYIDILITVRMIFEDYMIVYYSGFFWCLHVHACVCVRLPALYAVKYHNLSVDNIIDSLSCNII